MFEILKQPSAKNDIKKIWRYSYNNWGENQANKYVNELGQAINSIADNQMIGSVIDHVLEGYRMHHYKHHLIIYRFTQNTIVIVRVLGENMDVKRHLKNTPSE